MTVKVPKVTFDIESAVQKVQNQAQKILFIGQKLPAGTATPLTIIEDIPNDKSWDTLFDPKSILAGMFRTAKNLNQETRMDAIALEDNGASVDAEADITIVGTATATTELTLYVGSKLNHAYTISVSPTDTETIVAAAWETAINADTDRVVEASAALGVLTLTAQNAGLEGNSIGLRVVGDLGGLTSITVPHMASGTLSPDISTIPTLVGNARYQHIVMPASYDVSAIATWLDGRFNVSNDIRNGTLIISVTDSVTDGKALGNGYDNKSLDIHFNKEISRTHYEGSALFELDTVIASQFAAIAALRLTDGANISKYTNSTYGARDAFGGAHIASKPYHNTPFFNLPVIDGQDELTDVEQDDLNEAGLFFLGNNRPRTTVIAGDVVTTYKTNAITGQPDGSFKYQNYVDTLSEIREYFVNNSRQRFSQSRLTEGGIVFDLDMVNETVIEAYMDDLYGDLETQGLTVARGQALRYFKRFRTATIDSETGKATVNMQVPIVTQLREIKGVMQVSFTIDLQQAAA